MFRVVCDAVQHAHRALIVHRDLKPSNIFVSRSGDVKLLDFGIAKLLDPAAWGFGSPVTRAEMQLITPEYAAPEQAGGGQITTATDVYALGVVLYELLTGVRPREYSGTGAASHAHDARPPVAAPSEALRRLPRSGAAGSRRFERRIRGDLDRIVLTALRDEPERRYASAGQLGEEIDRFLEGRAVLAQPDTVAYRVRTFVRRNRLAVTAAAVLVSCITTFGVVAALQARALAEQSRIAGLERDKAEQVVRVLVDLFETTNPSVRPDGDRMPIGQFLAGAEGRALAQLSGAPLVRAKLQQVFGLIHVERGEFTPARTALEEALAAQRRLVGPDHPDALESLHALGQTIRELGDHARARELLDESIARHRRIYGDDHDKTARAIVALAPLVAATDLDAERTLLTRALEIRRRVLPPTDPELALTLGALAGHHQRRGELERSRELYRQALAVFRDPGERRHPASVTLMGDYASLLSTTLKAHDEAEATLREAIAVAEQVLGPGTLTVADLTNDLAVVLAALGRHADAERALRDSIRPSCRAVWRVPLARPQRRTQHRPRPCLAAALPGRTAMAGPGGSIRVLEDGSDIGLEGIRAQRAWIVFLVGRPAEAVDAASRAVSAIEGMKDPNDGHVLAYSRIVLARLLSETGRPDAAEPVARAATAWFERWGRAHPKFAGAECELGRAQMLQGQTSEGRVTLERCLPIYRAWGHADPHSVRSLDRLLTDGAPTHRRGQR